MNWCKLSILVLESMTAVWICWCALYRISESCMELVYIGLVLLV